MAKQNDGGPAFPRTGFYLPTGDTALAATGVPGRAAVIRQTLPVESLSLHPEAHRVPEMPPDQYAAFAADVKVRGVLQPLKLKPGTRLILDGRTRLRAAKEAGLASVPVEEVVLDVEDADGLLYMLRAELSRRHLTRDQRAALAADLEEQFARAAKSRQKDAGAKGGHTAGRGRPKERGVAEAPHPNPVPAPKSRELAAKVTGANPRAVSDAKLVKANAPHLHLRVKDGSMKLAHATRQVKAAAEPKPARGGAGTEAVKAVEVVPAAAEPKPPVGSVVVVPVEPGSMSPCPFCGCVRIAHRVLVGGMRAFTCEDCQARGPSHAEAEVARTAWNKRAPPPPPKPERADPTSAALRELGGFPAALATACNRHGYTTVGEVLRAADGLDARLTEPVRIYGVLRRVRGTSPAVALKATNAVLGASGRMHTRLTRTELERAAFPASVYGWSITYTTNRGDERDCHFVGTEAVARKKAALKTGFEAVVKADPLTERQYVAAYGKGRM
jgi:Lar family restriction alleviation protein